jgi:RimJ/RimL family protein N-acetyltransferase
MNWPNGAAGLEFFRLHPIFMYPHEAPMNLNDPLFEGQKIRLAAIDHEKDPEIETRWMQDISYLRMLSSDLSRPLSPSQLKKHYQEIEKEQEESRSLFYFTIRQRPEDRLVGFARISWVEWSNGAGMVQIGIGDARDRRQGYGSEVLKLLLRYAFAELNLYRLTAVIPEYNDIALHVFQKAGYTQEVRQRQVVNRDGQLWDLIHLGILRQEWQA